MRQRIDPKQLIRELTLAGLCQTAEEYYRNLPEPALQMSQPFASTMEAPQLLYKMGLLLYGLRLGKSMVVLDFGAGTCWFSRLLNQMQCITISVDVSESALELGKKLFEVSPIVGEYLQPPRFVPFDGEHIEVADDSVDRIICFNTLHHVPNLAQVLSEFFRVLKPGGIVGFSEPGIYHSQGAAAQYEMSMYVVLENDIHMDEIKEIATDIGFSDLRIKLVNNPIMDLDYSAYERFIEWSALGRIAAELRRDFWATVPKILRRKTASQVFKPSGISLLARILLKDIAPAMQSSTVFFLTKGTYIPDSRSHMGLKHEIGLLTKEGSARVGEPMELTVRVKNVGQSKWLHRSIRDIGVVKVGVHLLDANGQLLENDFARGGLKADVMPGEAVTVKLSVTFTEPGEYVLSVDLVAEHIYWFQVLGSQPQLFRVTVA